MKVFAHVRRAARTKHVDKRTGEKKPRLNEAQFEFAQKKIIDMFPQGLPTSIRPKKLTKDVRAALANDPDWLVLGYEKPIHQRTVMRAWDALRRP
jgi:hypothetical protein